MTLVEVIGTKSHLGHHKWSGVECECHETIEMAIVENVAATAKHHGQQPRVAEHALRKKVMGCGSLGSGIFNECVKLSYQVYIR